MTRTQRGIPCPACEGKEKTEYVALLPINREGVHLEPHNYAVGPKCYREQWKLVYGGKVPCPIAPPSSAT